ncbi:MAG TPA: transposase [Candidatus Limnocylindrales bacterium]|jgi:REP element-mobilizing transposase RayT|nr:transposase [Candidatus Limnocylindrales bacterium]
MPRELRIQYPGAIYHVLNRGDQRDNIFLDDQDRQRFLSTLEEACRKTDWEVHAYCLMRNHFHLVIETPRANLVAGMHWLSGVYTKRFNIRHKLCGHVLAGRYKALIVDGGDNGYLRTVCDYVHLNPVRANLLSADQPLESFVWSSYGAYLKPAGERPAWLRVDRLLGEKGIPKDSEAGRRMFALQMERRRAEESAARYEEIRRSWFLGCDRFREELLAAAAERIGLNHYGSERYETGVQKAEQIVAQEMQRLGWTEEDLRGHRKGDQRKVIVARRLRQETTMSLKWIAQRLQMGSWTYVSNLLHSPSPAKNQTQQQLPLCQ